MQLPAFIGTLQKKSYFSRSDEFSGNLLELEMENCNIVSFTTHLELDIIFLSFLIIPRHPNTS